MHRFLFALPLFLAGTALAQPVFEGLGFVSFARDLSADGTQITGAFFPSASNSNTTAYRWSTATDVQSLGLFPGSTLAAGSSYTQARGMNATTVVGYGRTSDASQDRAFRWDAGAGYTLLPTPAGYSSASASAISADGSVVFGESFQSSGGFHYTATRWTISGATTLGVLPGYTSSFIYDVSADGSVATGNSGNSGAFVWTQATGMTALGPAVATAISADGTYVVGTTTNYSGTQAYRWSQATGVVELGTLSPTDTSSFATDVSADGSVVVGLSSGDSGAVPFIWTSATGMLDLRSVIVSNGGNLSSWTLSFGGGLSISDDGLTIVGNGAGPNSFNEVWIARLTSIPEPAAAATWIAAIAGAFFCGRRLLRRRRA